MSDDELAVFLFESSVNPEGIQTCRMMSLQFFCLRVV